MKLTAGTKGWLEKLAFFALTVAISLSAVVVISVLVLTIVYLWTEIVKIV